MIKRLFTIATLCTAIVCTAQEPEETTGLLAAKCFAEAPAGLFSLIDNNTRLDMLDYYHAGIEKTSTNSVGGDCIITHETPYSVALQGGNGINYQLFVLNPTSPMPIIGLIETVATPIDDSKITFYNSRWGKLPPGILAAPNLADWLNADGKKHREDVEEALPFILSTYVYDPDTKHLTITNNMSEYFLDSDTPKAMSYVKDKLVYIWDGKKFKLAK